MQQSRGLTAAEVAHLLDQARNSGKADISMSTFYRLVREHHIEKTLPGDRVKEALYNEDQVRDLIEHGTPTKRRSRAKMREALQDQQQTRDDAAKQAEGTTDWIQPTDLAYVYVLDTELYGVENSVSPTTTLTWWRKNPTACRILFDKHNRKDIWGTLSVIPMEEETIHRILRGELSEQDITADQVLEYLPGCQYSCYVASVAIRPEHRQSFGQLLHSMLSFWCEQYPDIQITSLYGFALDEERGTGLRLIRKLYFAPRYDLGANAWELRLDRYSPSPVIQQFQECLQQRFSQRDRAVHLPAIEDKVISVPVTIPADRSIFADAVYQLAKVEDISALALIDEAIFGPSGMPLDEYIAMHRMWWEQNQEVFHVLKSQGKIVGYVSTIPLPLEKVMGILKEETRPREIKPEEIGSFEPGKPLDIYIVVLGIDNGFTTHQKRLLAGKLINGLTDTFCELGLRGVNIRAVYARSRFEEGITILKHTGFQEMKDLSPVNGKHLFRLDLETSDEPFARVYKEGLANGKKQKNGHLTD